MPVKLRIKTWAAAPGLLQAEGPCQRVNRHEHVDADGVGMTLPEILAVGARTIRIASLVRGSVLLVRETGIGVRIVSEGAARVRARARLQ